MNRRPNILFINTDQHTWDAISAYGNPYVQTPNIDRLVENGVSFMRSYCTDPVCAPTRSSWATSRYSSETGVPLNPGSMHEDIPDIGQLLEAGGYRAYHAGKWHVPGRDVRSSFRCLYHGYNEIGAGGAEYHDPVSTRAVIDFLSRDASEEPFFLQVGIINPHDICQYEHGCEYRQAPDPVALGIIDEHELPPLPPNFDFDPRETATQIALRRGESPHIHTEVMRAAATWGERQWRALGWQLYRFVEKADVEVGLIIDALEASAFRDDTLIIFSVDHGESAGCHQMIQKFTLYEESIKVPFVAASFSERFGIRKGRRDHQHAVSGVDLLPTVLDYADIAPPESARGTSLRPVIEGGTDPTRRYAYVQSNCLARALVGPRYKYITEFLPDVDATTMPEPHGDHMGLEQLFDLQVDPHETINLAPVGGHDEIIAEMKAELLVIEQGLERRPVGEQVLPWVQLLNRQVDEWWQQHSHLAVSAASP